MGSGSTQDDSGFTFDGTLIHSRTGSTINLPLVQSYGTSVSGTASDSNGNTIANNGNGTFTDTLGATALNITGAGTAGSPLSLTYPVTLQSDSVMTASASVSYHTYTVQTNFQCSGIGEYGATNVDLVDHITLADGSTYTFSYEATPGVGNGVVTGRLASIVLPTGGSIAYSYSQGCNGSGINTDGTPATLTRTTSDGTKTYARAISGALSTTNTTDEKSKSAAYTFTSNTDGLWYETERKAWQGATSGTPLQDRITKYNTQTSPAQLSGSISQMDVLEQFDGGSQTHLRNVYDISGNLTASNQLDVGNNDAVLTSTAIQYNAVGGVSSSVTTDGASHTISSATYGYDETALTTTSGIPQHSAASGTRGNQTSAHISTGSSTIDSTTTYYDTGVPKATTTPNGTTQYSYDSTQTFVTQTTLPTPSSGVSLSNSASYDQQSGMQISTTGMNAGETVQVTQYDRLLRPLAISQPDGGLTSYTFYSANDSGVSQTIGNGQSTSTRVLLDGYGRKSRVAVFNGQSSNAWYQQDFCYDAAGLLQFQSLSYQGAGYGTPKHCSGSGTSYTYDALGRVLTVVNSDGTVTTQYSGRAVKTTDVNGVSTIVQADILGRTSGVCEISSDGNMPGSGAPNSCGMDIAGTGFVTTYGYDLANHTATVTQGAQTRTTITDAAGRTVSTTEPERGTTLYSYAYNSKGLVVTRTRPKANQSNSTTVTHTTTQYDSLGRMETTSYDDGLTTEKDYNYDIGNFWPVTQTNLKGRLASISGLVNPNWSGTLFSYDAMGRTTLTSQCVPSNCGNEWKTISQTFDLAGRQTSQTDAFGTITYGRSTSGEVTSITSSYSNAHNPATLVSNVTSGPFGPLTYSYGNGLSQIYYYDALGRQSAGWVCPQSPSMGCPGNPYGYSIGIKGSQVPVTYDNVTGQNTQYTYDEFNRLKSTNYGGGATTFNYVYDRYGNRWQQNAPQGGPGFNVLFNATTNRLSASGVQYDAAGNLTNDGNGNSYQYDAEGNVLSVSGGMTAQYTYDSFNHRVRSQVNGVATEYVYDYAGRRVLSWLPSSNTNAEERVYWDGKQIAFRASDGTTYFDHQDWLGTERLRTNYAGANANYYTSLPFGDGYGLLMQGNAADQDNLHFAGLEKDSATADHAQFRQLSNTYGRWMSPDPYDGSMDFGNPQSLNRYSYVLNNPLSLTDPSGLDACTREVLIIHEDGSTTWGATDCNGGDQGGGVGISYGPSFALPPFRGGGDSGSTQNPAPAPNNLTRLIANAQSNLPRGCNQAFANGIPKYTNANFFNQLFANPIVQMPNPTSLRDPNYGHDAVTSPSTGQITLRSNFFNLQPFYQQMTVVHEGIHSYTGWTDNQVMSKLGVPNDGNGTSAITDWIMGGCKSQ